MGQYIIYQNDRAGISVITPAPECGLTIEQIAQKDVPAGTTWRVVGAADLPPYDVRDQWRWTDSGPLTTAQG